jgi:phosphoserine phosphatase RsbU/P
MSSFPFKDRRRPVPDSGRCSLNILSCRAIIRDNQLHNQFLKELVKKYAQAQRNLIALNRELTDRQNLIDEDLKAAAWIQRSLLPQNIPRIPGWGMAWQFAPSEAIGGDIFNIFWLDDHHIGIYMMDVSGHGVQAAMVTVSVSQMMLPHTGLVVRKSNNSLSDLDIVPPKDVVTLLDAEYPMERFDQFFSMIYLVMDVRDGRFVLCNAGHMPVMLFRRDGGVESLKKGGTVVGLGGMVPFEEQEEILYKGDRLLLYTDGVTDYMNGRQEIFGKERFSEICGALRDKSVKTMVDGIYDALKQFGEGFPIQDDVTILGVTR